MTFPGGTDWSNLKLDGLPCESLRHSFRIRENSLQLPCHPAAILPLFEPPKLPSANPVASPSPSDFRCSPWRTAAAGRRARAAPPWGGGFSAAVAVSPVPWNNSWLVDGWLQGPHKQPLTVVMIIIVVIMIQGSGSVQSKLHHKS